MRLTALSQATTALLGLSLLVACGQAAAPVVALRPVAKPVVAAKPVVKQTAVMDIAVPAAEAGSITMNVTFPARKGYALTATVADVEKLTVVLKIKGLIFYSNLSRAEVTRAQMVSGRGAVQFTGLASGKYQLVITASDKANAELATATENTEVSAGKTTTVTTQLKVSTEAAAPKPEAVVPTASGVDVGLEVVNG